MILLRTWRGLLAWMLLVAVAASAPATETAAAAPGMARNCAPAPPAAAAIEAFFPPWDDAQQQLLAVLDEACEQVLVQAFLLTSREVAAGLVAARQRGVDVRVLGDARQHADTPASLLLRLVQAGIPVWLEARYRHAHNKVIVVDGRSSRPVVLTGSYNFTWSAQYRNAENLLIIRGHPALAQRYADNWERHQLEATRLTPR